MANEQNLKRNFTRAERQENGRKGAAVTNAKIASRKSCKELLEMALKMPDDETGLTNDYAVAMALIEKAKKGSIEAYGIIRDTLGERPVDKFSQTDSEGNDLKEPPVFNINPVKIIKGS